jgi:hypothetical protein
LPRTFTQSAEEVFGEEQVCVCGEQRIHWRNLFSRTVWWVRRRRVRARRRERRVDVRTEDMSCG